MVSEEAREGYEEMLDEVEEGIAEAREDLLENVPVFGKPDETCL